MLPPNHRRSGQHQEEGRNSSHPVRSSPHNRPSFISDVSRVRSDESWVEISSRPSSSSLSSAATDEIVTTGLRVQRSVHGRRRRRLRPGLSRHQDRLPGNGSSQDEYEETESEDDQVLTSSTEIAAPGLAARSSQSTSSLQDHRDQSGGEEEDNDHGDEDEDDENGTALGVRGTDDVFTPQPNLFSHPPASQSGQYLGSGPYVPPRSSRLGRQTAPYPPPRPQHSPYDVVSPSNQADHDAALRASLSTLLSCAAAARALSKHSRLSGRVAGTSNIEPSTLQIVPESALPGADSAEGSAKVGSSISQNPRSRSSSKAQSQGKGKRKASATTVKGVKERATKKPKRVLEDTISPTLFTWVVSAGVVVLVSAIGFSAGYAMGKEAGRAEVNFIDTAEGRRCGRDAVKGLKRFRWGAGGAGVVRV